MDSVTISITKDVKFIEPRRFDVVSYGGRKKMIVRINKEFGSNTIVCIRCSRYRFINFFIKLWIRIKY